MRVGELKFLSFVALAFYHDGEPRFLYVYRATVPVLRFHHLLLPVMTQSDTSYPSRYSNEYKYRPAASPIITETLIDGRTKLRGALPTPEPTPVVSKRLAAKRKARKAKAKKSLHKSRDL